jgi:translation initiation factor 2B subunit (eIF-2B alpha/beta/delta family)
MVSIEELLSDRSRGALAIALDAAELLHGLAPEARAEAAARLVAAHPAMAPLRHLARSRDPAQFASALRAHHERTVVAAIPLVAGRRVLTISASALVEDALRRGKPAEVHCLRSEPGGEGKALAARLGATLWDDCDLPLAAQGADIALTGADAVGPDAFVNKVGTAALCQAIPTWLLDVPEKRVGREDFAACARSLGDLFEIVPLSSAQALE